jgi:hypothetical protein
MTCLKWPKLKYNQKVLRDKERERKIKWEGGRDHSSLRLNEIKILKVTETEGGERTQN